jgi:hypothetical protein
VRKELQRLLKMIKDVWVGELRQKRTGEQMRGPGYFMALAKGGESGIRY